MQAQRRLLRHGVRADGPGRRRGAPEFRMAAQERQDLLGRRGAHGHEHRLVQRRHGGEGTGGGGPLGDPGRVLEHGAEGGGEVRRRNGVQGVKRMGHAPTFRWS